MIRVLTLALLLSILVLASGPAARAAEPSRCLAFVDYDFIWTLEVVKTKAGQTPILNAVALGAGEWELQPRQIHLLAAGGTEYKVESFSFDSGDQKNPFTAPYFKVRGGEFAGIDMVGDFSKLDLLEAVQIDFPRERFVLQTVNCDTFDELAGQIGQIEIGSGNMTEVFRLLNIPLLGSREVR